MIAFACYRTCWRSGKSAVGWCQHYLILWMAGNDNVSNTIGVGVIGIILDQLMLKVLILLRLVKQVHH